MLWVQIPLEATLFFKDTLMQILYKNARNVRFVLFTKTSIRRTFMGSKNSVMCPTRIMAARLVSEKSLNLISTRRNLLISETGWNFTGFWELDQ